MSSFIHIPTAQDGSAIQIDKGSILTNSPPTVLLVYSPCLHQEMSVLSTKLQNKTMLKNSSIFSLDVGWNWKTIS
ncbi:hypothetical protein E2C01_063493 [Portunus trituberculatus]|uniref:Uncharacterized protein n=1 Tax=Portunus trituberculatus TaxID=210409 RepID=A0A5B7HIB0_PORTR|nr:hypothetical protein [Portunus trituberculatus]